jgi:hypothetical protein
VGPQLHSSATTGADTAIGQGHSEGGASGINGPASLGSRRSNLPGAKVSSVDNRKDSTDVHSYMNGANKTNPPASSASLGSTKLSKVR